MFELSVLRHRWIILALGAGLVLVLTFFLAYLPMKRPRDPESYQSAAAPKPRTWRESLRYMPWILVLTYAGSFLYSAVVVIWRSFHPPNY